MEKVLGLRIVLYSLVVVCSSLALFLSGPVLTIAIVYYIVALVVYTLSLWVSAKIIGEERKFLEFLILAAIAAVVELILDLLASSRTFRTTGGGADLGAVISIVVLFVLLSRWIGFFEAFVICFIAYFLRLGLFNGLLWIFAR